MTDATTPDGRAADLHLHTCYSDGTMTPEEIVRTARSSGLSTIAVTDHDTLESWPEALVAARAAGLELIPGVELSTRSGAEDVHLLGYCMDVEDDEFCAWLARLKAARLRRLELMVGRLQALGVRLTVQDVLTLSGPGTVGRLHVARAIVQCGGATQINEAFDKYIGTNKPAYVVEYHPTPEEAILRLRNARGVPVLAHPSYIKDGGLIESLIAAGLAGIEAYHSSHDVSQQLQFRAIAERAHLLMTGGSDCHGMAKGQPLIGTVKLPYTYVEQLRTWHATTY